MEKDLTTHDMVVKKKVSRSCHSSIRTVLINNERIILKMANKVTPRSRRRYFREKKVYMRLTGEDFLPTLKYYDDKHLILGLTDVGDSLSIWKENFPKQYNTLIDKNNKEIKDAIDILCNKYHLYHNDLQHRNICVDRNTQKARLIDFEYCSKRKRRKQKYFVCEKLCPPS